MSDDLCREPIPASETERWGFPDFVTCDLPAGHEGLHRGRWTGLDAEGNVIANEFQWGE